jgi:hypothetical protein
MMFKNNLLPFSGCPKGGGNGFNFQKRVISIVRLLRTSQMKSIRCNITLPEKLNGRVLTATHKYRPSEEFGLLRRNAL